MGLVSLNREGYKTLVCEGGLHGGGRLTTVIVSTTKQTLPNEPRCKTRGDEGPFLREIS